MDKFPLRSGFCEHVSFSKSIADDSNNVFKTSDSALMNQSIIISGNVNNVNREIHDISNNYTSDELNTNIDALMPDKKAIFLQDKNNVDTLSGNLLKSHCTDEPTFPIPCNESDVHESKSLNSAEAPEVEITSCEESNGTFRVKFHIKSFGKK